MAWVVLTSKASYRMSRQVNMRSVCMEHHTDDAQQAITGDPKSNSTAKMKPERANTSASSAGPR